jgi:hypothetical protein
MGADVRFERSAAIATRLAPLIICMRRAHSRQAARARTHNRQPRFDRAELALIAGGRSDQRLKTVGANPGAFPRLLAGSYRPFSVLCFGS